MKRIQSTYGGGSITEPQLEAEFHQSLPNQTAACHARLDQFFTQWFDTAYPSGGGANKPQITGPRPRRPRLHLRADDHLHPRPRGADRQQRLVRGQRLHRLERRQRPRPGHDARPAASTRPSRPTARSPSRARPRTRSAPPGRSPSRSSATRRRRSRRRRSHPRAIGAWYSPRTVMLSATDPTSGVASTSYRLDGGAWTAYMGPFFVATYGPHTLDYRSTDAAGNVEVFKTVSWGNDPALDQIAGLTAFVASLGLDKGLAKGLHGPPRRRGAPDRPQEGSVRRAGQVRQGRDQRRRQAEAEAHDRAGAPAALGQPDRGRARVHPGGLRPVDGRARRPHVHRDGRQLRAPGSDGQRPHEQGPRDRRAHRERRQERQRLSRSRRAVEEDRRQREEEQADGIAGRGRSTRIVADISRAIRC